MANVVGFNSAGNICADDRPVSYTHLDVYKRQLKDFYCDVVGLKAGPREGFTSRGFWLYIGDKHVMHLAEYRGEGEPLTNVLTTIDHISFTCTCLLYTSFIEVETPMLTRSTPEGARDYLVPSRVHAGQFFALPQSPQLFKQLLMVSGFDRYFQITKCFRDEDLRADRQPEFTQVDIETSFMSENDIMDIVEEMIRQMLKKVQNVDLPAKFPRMPFAEAMNKYGSDKPDMRVTLEITELSDVMKDVDFKVFAGAANAEGGRVAALRVPNGAAISRSEIDAYTEFVKIYGAKGLAYIKINDTTKLNEEGLQSPIVKNIHVKALQAIIDRTGAQNGDIVFFGADKTLSLIHI